MVTEIIPFLLQYLLVLFACCVFYLIGNLLLKLFPLNTDHINSKWLHYYTAIVLGIVTMVLIYSLILAKGKTINILFLVAFAGLFFAKKNKAIINSRKSIFRDWPIVFLVISSFLFVLLFHLFPESENKQIDALHYLQISQYFNDLGQENNFGALGFFAKDYSGTIPYHYFEFWLNALLLKCFSGIITNIQIFRFVCYGIICVGVLLGLFALTENILKKELTIAQKLFCIFFIFYIPNFLGYIGFFKTVLIFPFDNNILDRPNLRTLYLFLPGVLITLGKSKYKWQSLFWIVSTAIVSLINFVVLCVAVPLFCIATFKHKETKKYSIFLFSSFLFTAVLYFFFYHFTLGKLNTTPDGFTKYSIISYCIKSWKLILFSSATSIFYCFFMPLVVLICLKSKKKLLSIIIQPQQTMTLFLCIVIFSAILIARTLTFLDDAYQFAFLGYASGAILFFILLLTISIIIKFENWIYYLLCGSFLMSFLVERFLFHPDKYKNVFIQNGSNLYGGKKYSEKYLQNILAVFPSGSKVNGAFWADRYFYDSIPFHSSREPNLYALPSRYLLANKLAFNFEVCLSDSASIMYGIDTLQKANYDYLRSAIQRSVFYIAHGNENINKQRIDFINNYSLQYLILTRNADTTIISKLPILKYFQDDSTGERFYVIDTTHLKR